MIAWLLICKVKYALHKPSATWPIRKHDRLQQGASRGLGVTCLPGRNTARRRRGLRKWRNMCHFDQLYSDDLTYSYISHHSSSHRSIPTRERLLAELPCLSRRCLRNVDANLSSIQELQSILSPGAHWPREALTFQQWLLGL